MAHTVSFQDHRQRAVTGSLLLLAMASCSGEGRRSRTVELGPELAATKEGVVRGERLEHGVVAFLGPRATTRAPMVLVLDEAPRVEPLPAADLIRGLADRLNTRLDLAP